MSIYDPVREILARELSSYLGKYKLTNGALIPSIYVGNPPAKMARPGLEVIITDTPYSAHQPLLNFESNSRRRYQVALAAWTPDLVGTGADRNPLNKSLTEIGELLYRKFEDIRCVGTMPSEIGEPARSLYYIGLVVSL